MNHAIECAFSVSFGDEPCDCDGPEAPPDQDRSRAIAREHLALARRHIGRGAEANNEGRKR